MENVSGYRPLEEESYRARSGAGTGAIPADARAPSTATPFLPHSPPPSPPVPGSPPAPAKTLRTISLDTFRILST